MLPSIEAIVASTLSREIALVGALVAVTLYLLRRQHRRPYVRLVPRFSVAHHVRDAPDLLAASATEISEAVRSGELTAREVVSMFIDHIEKVNPLTNSLVNTRFEQALVEADAIDALSPKEKASLLLCGVPFVSKECFELEGMPYTTGLVRRTGLKGRQTNEVVRRVMDAGAICVGQGNLSEACMWMESDNKVYGRTNNPYDLSRTVGGSSGGNSSAVAACLAPLTITSDVGGSTRIPGSWNGVFGHKPTGRAVSNANSIPAVHGAVNRYCQLGPTARFAEDLMPVLRLIAGPCANDDYPDEHATRDDLNQQWLDPHQVDVSKLRVLDVRDQPSSEVLGPLCYPREPWSVEAHERVVDYLGNQLGCPVTPARFPLMDKAFDIWGAMLGEAAAPFRGVISEGKSYGAWPFMELIWWLITFGYGGDHTLPALGLANLERITEQGKAQTAAYVADGVELKEQLSRALGDDGVMIFPSLPTVAPQHGPLPFLIRAGESGATGILNVLEFPSTTIPLGLDEDLGLPMSVQIVANHGRDDLCLAVAVALEQAGIARWVAPGDERQ